MKSPYRQWLLGGLLTLSGLILSSLVPGGPIENRDFSHIEPVVLLVFNVLLTALGLGSFVLAVLVLRRVGGVRKWVISAAAGYLLVYVADLLGWFPPTPTPMSSALVAAELTGVILAVLLLGMALYEVEPPPRISPYFELHRSVLFTLTLLALAIVVFATVSAMGLSIPANRI